MLSRYHTPPRYCCRPDAPQCYNCGRSYTSHSRTCRFHLPAERVVAGGDHLWAAVCLSSCPDRMPSCPCILRQRVFRECRPDVEPTLQGANRLRILHVTGPGDRCGNDDDQRERDAQCVSYNGPTVLSWIISTPGAHCKRPPPLLLGIGAATRAGGEY